MREWSEREKKPFHAGGYLMVARAHNYGVRQGCYGEALSRSLLFFPPLLYLERVYERVWKVFLSFSHLSRSRNLRARLRF